VPAIYDDGLVDEIITISNQTAMDTSRLLARTEGIAGGISTGANLAACLELAQRPDMYGKTIVFMVPSFAERYLSTQLFEAMD
jgi:Cysteine synthase